MKGIPTLLILIVVGIITAMLCQCYLMDLLNLFETILALFLLAASAVVTVILVTETEHRVYKRITRTKRIIHKLKGEQHEQ